MSLSNILQPNGYDLYCNSITSATAGGTAMISTNQGFNRVADFNFTAGAITNILFDSIIAVPTGLPAFPLTYDAGTGRITNNTGKPVLVSLYLQASFKNVSNPSTNTEIAVVKNGGSSTEATARFGNCSWISLAPTNPGPSSAVNWIGTQPLGSGTPGNFTFVPSPFSMTTNWEGPLSDGEFLNAVVYQNANPTGDPNPILYGSTSSPSYFTRMRLTVTYYSD